MYTETCSMVWESRFHLSSLRFHPPVPSLLRGSGLGAYRKIFLLFKFVSYSPPSTHLERPERLPLRWRRVYAMFSRYNLLHHFFYLWSGPLGLTGTLVYIIRKKLSPKEPQVYPSGGYANVPCHENDVAPGNPIE
jgi:hypothetical protein